MHNIWDYRELISPKQGNLGIFILPSAFFSIIACFVLTILFFFYFIQRGINKFLELKAVDFTFEKIFSFNWSLFFINTDLTVFLGIFSIISLVGTIWIGIKLSAGRINFKKILLIVPYAIFYNFLYFIWWIGTIYHLALKKESKW